jgi:hypothetical protein
MYLLIRIEGPEKLNEIFYVAVHYAIGSNTISSKYVCLCTFSSRYLICTTQFGSLLYMYIFSCISTALEELRLLIFMYFIYNYRTSHGGMISE